MWRIDGVTDGPTRKCLRQMVTARSWHLLRLYKHYKKGFLLKSGGIYDQPNSYLEAMETIDTEIGKQIDAS